MKLNLHDIKNNFSRYIDLVESGETIVVCKRNIPVAEIRRIETKEKRTPVLGSAAAGKDLSAFVEAMAKDEIGLWEGEDVDDPLRKYEPAKRKRRK